MGLWWCCGGADVELGIWGIWTGIHRWEHGGHHGCVHPHHGHQVVVEGAADCGGDLGFSSGFRTDACVWTGVDSGKGKHRAATQSIGQLMLMLMNAQRDGIV